MPETIAITSRFPVARCDTCQKDVLTCVVLDESGDERRVCAHCDTPISRGLEWISAVELESTGYHVGAPRPHAKSGGCGGGCSCSAKRP